MANIAPVAAFKAAAGVFFAVKEKEMEETSKFQTTRVEGAATVPPVKEWSNPTPAGLVALAVACVCFFALLTGKVSISAMPLIGCWLLGGFAVQIVVALLDLKSGNTTGGNTFLYFSAFFMLVSGLEMLLKYNAITAGNPLDGRVDGYAWMLLTFVVWLWTPAFFTKFSLLSVIVILLDAALPFIALNDLRVLPPSLVFIPAWLLLGCAVIAVYLCSATIVNNAFKKTIYPLP